MTIHIAYIAPVIYKGIANLQYSKMSNIRSVLAPKEEEGRRR
jgi:hypothetical protein